MDSVLEAPFLKTWEAQLMGLERKVTMTDVDVSTPNPTLALDLRLSRKVASPWLRCRGWSLLFLIVFKRKNLLSFVRGAI